MNRDYNKVIHIHTDQKFVSDSNRFDGENFKNDILLIGEPAYNLNLSEENITVFKYSPNSVNHIVNRCMDADLVVVYGLDLIKARIIFNLPKEIPVAWRFFGYELYRFDMKMSLSETTSKYLEKSGTAKLKNFIKLSVKSLKSYLRWGTCSDTFHLGAIRNIDYFLCFSKHEYDLLASKWTDLPEFVRLPLSRSYKPEEQEFDKEKIVIIGNNRSSYNNNIDIIKLIESAENRSLYHFVLLFSYGEETNYSMKVREEVDNKPYYEVIDNFMTHDKFEGLYHNASAAVFNGYRQMALGNIFSALKNGVKIYLNDRNVVMEWLCSEGINIYPVSDLKKDIEENRITLTKFELNANAENFSKMIDSYTNTDFQLIFNNIIEERKMRIKKKVLIRD